MDPMLQCACYFLLELYDHLDQGVYYASQVERLPFVADLRVSKTPSIRWSTCLCANCDMSVKDGIPSCPAYARQFHPEQEHLLSPGFPLRTGIHDVQLDSACLNVGNKPFSNDHQRRAPALDYSSLLAKSYRRAAEINSID